MRVTSTSSTPEGAMSSSHSRPPPLHQHPPPPHPQPHPQAHPPGVRTKRGLGFMYDGASGMGPGGGGGGINIFNKSGARAKKEDSDDVRGRMALNNGYDAPPSAISSSPALAHSNGADQHGSSLTVWTPVASGEDVDYRNWKLHFEPDVVSYVSEDTRLSTLQKKLVREPNATTSLAIAFQISDAIMQHENKHYVRRLTDVISDAIVEIFYSKHAEAVKEESARALGKVGFVIAEFSVEFEKFYGWLWKGFDDAKKESVQNLYLKGLASMLELEPRFGGGDQVLHMVMKDLQELLERTNQSGFLITLVDALGTISNWKPKLFEPIFQDVVDILVGWHIDSTQLPAVRTHMSQVLLSWNSYWIIDMEFSSSLLRQFMEDLEAFDEDVAKSDDPDNLKDISERMLSLMQVFNTVLSCLKTRQQNAITFLPPESSVWCENILDSFAKVLDKRHDEDILVVGQHSMILLMERIETLFAQKQKKIMSYVKRNIDLFSSLTFSGQVVTLGFLGRMFMLAGPKAKLTIVQKIVGTKSPVLQTSFCSESRIIRAAVDLFKIMLNSKDIHILQVVYRHLTSLLEESLVCLANCPRFLAKNEFSEEQFKREEHQRIFYFVLACISDIALAKGSVLSMWALDPTIFKLLTNNLGVVAVDFASGQPWLHFAILKLLQSHCSSHGQFISSSDVCASLTSNSISASPTAKYFSVILTLLSSLLKIVSSLCPASSELVLSWSKDVLQETLKSRLYIFDKPEFILFVSSLFKAGQMLGTNKEASKAVLQMIDFILKEFSLEGYYSCYDEAHNLTQLHMRSSDEEIRSLSYSILTSLPPLLVDWKSNEQTFDEKFIEMKKSIVHRKEDKRRSIAPQDFRVFVAAVLNMSAENEGGTAAHKKIVDKTNRQLECSVLSGVAKSKRVVEEYLKNVTNFHDLQTLHMCHSLSHYCINNKLKSPLGKAQDTLTTIEKVIRNVTANLLEGKTANIDMPGCRGLLVLFECLEKAMSNAYNGSAVFMPAPTKVVAVFFQANKDTCIGWISRLRMATIQLAFFAGDYAYVVRNAQESLARLAAMAASSGKKVPSPEWEKEFLKVVILMAISFTRLKCFQSLGGLFAWCKENFGMKLYWLKNLMELVKDKSESGTEALKDTLAKLLTSETSSYDNSCLSLIHRELSLGFAATCDFDTYNEWMQQYRHRLDDLMESEDNDSTTFLRALSEFSEGVTPSLPPPPSQSTPDPFTSTSLLTACHLKLLQAASCFHQTRQTWSDPGKIMDSLDSANVSLTLLMRDHRLAGNGEGEQQAHILSMVHRELHALVNDKGGRLDLLLTYKKSSHRSKPLLWIKKWGDYFVKYQKENDPQLFMHLNALNLEISKTARKEENLNLSYDYLYKALIGGYHSAGTARHQIGGYVQSLDFSSLILTADRAACIRQYAKLSYLSGEKENAVRAMCGIVNSVGALLFTSDSSAANAATAELFEVSSRAVHNLTSWFRADTGLIDSVYPDTKPGNTSSGGVSLTQVLQLEKNLVGHLEFLPVVEQATDNDMVVGRLLRHAVNQAPMMAKLWHSLATWALDLGEKVLESCQKEGISLTEDERQSVLQSLPPGATKSQMEPVFQLLQQHRLISQLGEKKMIEISRHEYMRNELAATAGIDDAQLIDKIHAVWMQLQRRTYFYHETAVNAYFEYIALNSGGNGDQLITATLRLLQLTVKYALELQESLQAGLEATPSAKWRPIIPQLFSRLNHPVRSVRNRISELICRIAQDFPHLIIFPAVVGSASSVTTEADKIYKHLTSVVDEDEGVIDEDSSDEVGPNPEMRGAYAQIVDAMVKQCGGAVEQVQRFVNELQRISLLWDELWLGTLQQYTHDIAKRIKKMEEEVHRLSRNDTLSLEEKKHLALDKYHIIFKPLLFVFEKVFSITDKQAETPHEAYFHRNYREIINKTMEKIRNPSDPCHPKESWGTFGQLQSTLSSKLLTKTSLKLSDISPTLLAMKGTQIPMPGLTDNREVDISSLENGLHILLTKTKPKKVAFQGNDGRKYTYLFKGLEDLHLDERIMQFLTIANVMMKKTGREYRARHYSVVPLGPRSGLIQWVGGPIPLYSIFKKCQVRQQMTTGDRKTGGGGSKSGTNIQKPSEAFYNKLYPLLRDKGIAIENRRSWPLSVMRQVMQELISETPDNLLAQELWYGSVDSQHWFELQQNMTRSLAVMSVIGYIIGLGDRHLDNLLMDLKHGEIIHIDHNICFEKGKHLRIPERVPCRLSQNIVRLFGLTGVEGLFRSACEHTLQTLRAGKDTLMCLLEAFIYDPLVDWTPGVFELGIAGAYHGGMQQGDIGGGGDRVVQDKRDMQSEITFSMYAVRVAEMKGPWMDNRTELLELLSGMEDRLVAYAEQKIVIGGIIKQLSKMHHSMAILKEAEANPSHRLYSLHDRFVEHNMIENAVKAAKEKVASFVEENEKWGNLHQRALITVSPVHLSKWTADLAAVNTNPNASGSLIKGFLENAGQGSLLEQFQNVEGSFCIGVENLKHTLLSCLQLLGHYGNISGLYPQSSKALHRTAQYVSLATRMTEDFTVATSQDVIADFTRRFIDTDFTAAAEDNGRRRLRQHHLLNLNYQMEAWGTEMNMRLRNIFQRMINEGIENSGAVMLELTGAKMELLQHLNGNDKGRVRMFGDIVVIRLATIASRLAELETVASKSEDGIVDVVPPGHENEWSLLDEIRMQLGVASNLLDTMDLVGAMPADSEAAAMAAEAFQQQQKVSKQIAQFSSNFYVIIMQEGLKSFQKEDQSVIAVAIQLTEILGSAGIPLEEILKELDISIHILSSGVSLSNEAVVNAVMEMKSSYDNLILSITETQTREARLTPGQMLFLAFDSLFNNLEFASDKLKTMTLGQQTAKCHSIESALHKMNRVAAAAATENATEISSLVALSLFVCRLVLLRDFFTLCTKAMLSFMADPGVLGDMLPSGDDMARTITVYLSEFYRRQMVGFATFNLSVFIASFVEKAEPTLLAGDDPVWNIESLPRAMTRLAHGKDQQHFFDLELTNIAAQMRKIEVAKYLEQNIEALQANQQMNQLQRASFQWFHEVDLPFDAVTFVPPVRLTFMTDLRTCLVNMASMQANVTEMLARYHELHGTVEQRLKWACGANPEVQDIFNCYSSSFVSQVESLKTVSAVMKSVTCSTNAVLHHEALRGAQTAEAVANDSSFMSLMGECQQSASLKEAQQQTLSTDELRLFSLSPPADIINAEWIGQTEEVISSRVTDMRKQMKAEADKLNTIARDMKESSRTLRGSVTSHQKLMTDVGALLRIIAKSEDYEIPEIAIYLSTYKSFSEYVTHVINGTMTEDDQTDETVRSLLTGVERVREFAGPIYDDVVGFCHLLKEDSVEVYKVKRNKKEEDDEKEKSPQHQQQKNLTEEKNQFAMNALRRVRLKLEGREPDALKRSSVAEQVDFIIHEATSLDNLALMYEGWTAWI